MPTIRVLVYNTSNLVYIASPTKLGGAGAAYVNYRLLSIIKGLNYTLISTNPGDECSEDGICSGGIGDIQKGKGDYFRPTPLIVLKTLGENLTIASISRPNYCYLAYKKYVELKVHYSTAYDIINSFDFVFWFLLLILLGFISLLLCLTIRVRSPSTRIASILWAQFEATVCQNYDNLNKVTTNWFLAFLLFSLVLIGILLSSSLQTGLISNVDYLKLDTFKDIIDWNYNPIVSSVSPCILMTKDANSEMSRKVAYKTKVIPYKSAEQLYQIILKPGCVLIADEITYNSIKHIGCSKNEQEQKRHPFDRSDYILHSSLSVYLLNRHNQPEINQIIVRRGYSALENKLLRYENLVKVINKYQGNEDGAQSCMDFKPEKQESFTPISMNYLSFSFIILSSGYLFGLSILFVEKFFEN